MINLFESLGRLKPLAQFAAVVGLIVLLILVAFNPGAGIAMISFLAALVAMQGKGSSKKDT